MQPLRTLGQVLFCDLYLCYEFVFICNTAARLAGWRRVTQQGVILYVMDGLCRLPWRTTPLVPVRGRDWPITKYKQTTSWATSRKEGMAWYSCRPMPSLWSRDTVRVITTEGSAHWLRWQSICYPPFRLDVVNDLRQTLCLAQIAWYNSPSGGVGWRFCRYTVKKDLFTFLFSINI